MVGRNVIWIEMLLDRNAILGCYSWYRKKQQWLGFTGGFFVCWNLVTCLILAITLFYRRRN